MFIILYTLISLFGIWGRGIVGIFNIMKQIKFIKYNADKDIRIKDEESDKYYWLSL